MHQIDPELHDLLRLTLTPGLGPVLISRLLSAFGSAGEVLRASARDLERVRGIGAGKSPALARGMKESGPLVPPELELAAQIGARLIPRTSPEYPPLLASISDAPPLIYARGEISPSGEDQYPVAIVGSRECTHYGLEQSERFATFLASSGLTVVSGGARGIDTAAHRGALRAGGRTIAVLGCGLAECYPPENRGIYDEIAGSGGSGSHGAIVSELPLRTPPDADNFPARNRLISGMSLGVIVIEAGQRSGSLITARLAAEDHGREVMAVPGRVDSAASRGTHDLLKRGGAALVTEPADVLEVLHAPARHAFVGSHADRYADPARPPVGELFTREGDRNEPTETRPNALPRDHALSDAQRTILAALRSDPLTIDQLSVATGLGPSVLRGEITLLELQRRVVREGSRLSLPSGRITS